MPQFVKMGLSSTGYMPGRHTAQRSAQRRAARRTVEPGFPWAGQFESRGDVDAYFAGDTIQCLLCGRHLRRLGGHLMRIHGVSEDAYRQRFNLPWRRGLTSAASHAAYAAALDGRGAELAALIRKPEVVDALRQSGRKRSRRSYHAAEATQRFVSINGKQFDEAVFDEFLNRVAAGRSPGDVASDDDMPSHGYWRAYRRDNPDYDRRFVRVWDALPFAIQAQSQMLGPRFENEARRLFDRGLSDHRIGEALGVTAMAVNKRTKPWRRSRPAPVSREGE